MGGYCTEQIPLFSRRVLCCHYVLSTKINEWYCMHNRLLHSHTACITFKMKSFSTCVAGTQFEKTCCPVQQTPVSTPPCFSSCFYYWVSLVSFFCCSGLIVPMLAGASAGVVSRIICHPIDTIKSKLQVEVVAERGVYYLNPKPLPNTQHL